MTSLSGLFLYSFGLMSNVVIAYIFCSGFLISRVFFNLLTLISFLVMQKERKLKLEFVFNSCSVHFL